MVHDIDDLYSLLDDIDTKMRRIVDLLEAQSGDSDRIVDVLERLVDRLPSAD